MAAQASPIIRLSCILASNLADNLPVLGWILGLIGGQRSRVLARERGNSKHSSPKGGHVKEKVTRHDRLYVAENAKRVIVSAKIGLRSGFVERRTWAATAVTQQTP